MKKFLSRLLTISSVLIILAFLIYAGFWFYIAQQMNRTVAAIWLQQAEHAIRISGNAPKATGFPAAPKLVFTGSVTDKNGNIYSSPEFIFQGFPVQTQALRLRAPKGLDFSGSVFHKPVHLDNFDLQIRIPYGFPPRMDRHNLQIWQKAGGTIPVERIEIRRSTLHLSGEGYLTLDDELQPAGAISAELTGLDDLLNELVRDGTIGRQQAHLAQAFINLLSTQNNEKGEQALASGINIENGNVYFGPIKAATLPQWTWEE